MRKLGYALATAFSVCLAVLANWYFGAMPLPEFLTSRADPDKLALVPQSSVSIAYLVEQERWLDFPLVGGTSQLKLISNAGVNDLAQVRRQRLADPARRWNYALEFEIIGTDGTVILRREHHHRADLSEFRSADGRLNTSAFYLREDLTPLAGAILNIDLAGLPAAAHLRIRAARRDADIAEIALRVYLPERNSEQRIAFLWQRLSEKQKEALARGSVFPHELLLETEKRNLLLNSWKAVGPRGAEGRDYRSRELYVLLDGDGEIVDNPIPPFGIVADSRVRATIPVPEAGGRLRLAFDAVPAPGAADDSAAAGDAANSAIRIRWLGTTLFERSETAISVTEARSGYSLPVAGGLVEVETPTPMAVRAYLAPPDGRGGEQEITPPPIYQRVFVATAEKPIVFRFDERTETSSLQVDLRRLRPSALTAGSLPLRARYAFEDDAGVILRTGEIVLDEIADSRYERVVGDYSGAALSDPLRRYFAVPPRALRLTIAPIGGAAPLLVAADSRPLRLAREIRIPDDFYDFGAAGKRIPAWFPLRPENYEEAVLENRSRVLVLQARPADEKPEIAAGNYQWDDYRPRGDWLARPIYAPRPPGTPERADTLPTTFSPLPGGRTVAIDLPDYQGMRVLAPTLLWLGEDAPVTFVVSIDDRPPLTLRAHGPFAEIALPPLAAGRHRLRLEPSQHGEAFLNHVRPASGALVRHIAARFRKHLVFEYERSIASEETLTVRLFQPYGKPHPADLRITVSAPTVPPMLPLDGWLFGERRASVRPDARFAAPVFGAGGRFSDGGQPVFIPLSEGAPLGKYRITVEAKDSDGYLAVSRLGPAVAAERRAHLQPEIRRAEIDE